MENENKSLLTNNGEVAVQYDTCMIADSALIAVAERAEKQVAALNKIMSAALKVTTPLDWTIIGGCPYLQETGAAKVGRLFGVSWRIGEPAKETRGDGHITYTYRGEFSWGGATIEAIGTRSSYDDFFAGAGKDSKAKTVDEVDIADVKKAAYTNCINNGIKNLIPGLRSITKEDLTVAGFDVSKIKGYGFNSSNPKAESAESADKRAKMQTMLMEMCGGDATRVANAVKHYTSFTKKDGSFYEGKDDISKLTESQVTPTYGKIKEEYEKWGVRQSDKLAGGND